jgi:DNA helicase II / ATP-dependent DNA helicase PcrA
VPASSEIADVRVLRMPSLSQSLEYVLAQVRLMLAIPTIKKVAIIGRKRSQIIPYQITFARENIPFYAAEDLQVFLSDAFGELKEMLAIKARAGAGPIPGLDAVADLLKLANKVKRFPLNKSDLQQLARHLQQERPRSLIAALDCLRRYQGPLKGGNGGGAMSETFFLAIAPLLHARTVADSIRTISLNFEGLQKDYGKSLDDIFYADPPFLYLAEYAARYGDRYTEFYDDIEKAIATLARVTSDNEDAPQNNSWKLPLHLMTALRAKGKEFDVVIILDTNRDIWPSKLAETDDQLEQERRVFYVALTRARKQLTLLVNDSMLGTPAAPSPYISEMGLTPQPFLSPSPK